MTENASQTQDSGENGERNLTAKKQKYTKSRGREVRGFLFEAGAAIRLGILKWRKGQLHTISELFRFAHGE